MIPTSSGALQILLILLPGFAAAYILQLLVLRNSQTDFDKVIEAGLFSFAIYASFLLFTWGNLPFDVIPAHPPLTEPVISWHLNRLIGLVLLTFFYAVGGVLYFKYDGNRVFRYAGLTVRTARRSIWNDTFQDIASAKQIVQVELGDKRSLLGLLVYYSDVAEDCSIYLSQASWVLENGSLVPIPGPGILLTKNANIQSISLLDPAAPPTSPPVPSPAL